MGAVSDRIRERVITGVRFGGQISPPAITAAIASALDEIYDRSQVARFDLAPISETEGLYEYDLPTLSEAPDNSRICRVLSVRRVTRDDSGDILNSTYLQDNTFSAAAGIGADGTAPTSLVLSLVDASPATATNSLIVNVAAAFPTDSYFPEVYLADVENAAVCKVISVLCSESGKPWADPNRSILEERNFKGALNRIRAKSIQGGTGRPTVCRAPWKFL